MKFDKKGMKILEAMVKEFNVKHDCLIFLAKKLAAIGTPKACISATRICCKLNMNIPTKFNNDVVKIISDNASSKSIAVRTETAISLREILIEGGFYEFAAINTLKKLIKDPQNSVQVFAFESLCWRVHSKTFFQNSIMSLFLSCLEIKSWRIRYVFVRQLPVLLNSLEVKNRKSIIPHFAKCIIDPELEVSILALQTIKSVSNLIEPEDFAEKILPELNKILVHENQNVKMALCSSVCYITPVLIKLTDSFLNLKTIVISLMKDPNAEVKIKLLLNSEPFLKSVISQNMNMTFMAFVHDLLLDKNWKIRTNAIKVLENFVIKFPEDFLNDEKIFKTLGEKLVDRIANVRKSAILCFKNIAFAQGTTWCERNCIPIFQSFIENPNYLYRTNFLFGVAEIYSLLSVGVQTKQADSILRLSKDPVANIRMLSLQASLKILCTAEDKVFEDKLRKISDLLQTDGDTEVKRIAKSILGTRDLKTSNDKMADLIV